MLQRLLATLLTAVARYQQQSTKHHKNNGSNPSMPSSRCTIKSFVFSLVVLLFGYHFLLRKMFFGPRPVSVKRMQTDFPNAKTPLPASQIHSLWRDDEFECLGWQQLYSCQEEQQKKSKLAVGLGSSRNNHQDLAGANGKYALKSCQESIGKEMAGYCMVRNRTSGETLKLMVTSCHSLRQKYKFNCEMAREFSEFPLRALHYEHSPVAPSLAHARLTKSKQNNSQQNPEIAALAAAATAPRNGIAMVVYDRVLVSAYATIRLLRYHGCDLPIELWYRPDEMSIDNPVIHLLLAKYNVRIRPIFDPRAKGYLVKAFALYYSDFDDVLLLDCDNLPARDPTYLFKEPEFLKTGALFWPDFWQPDNSIFELTRHSPVWELMGMPFEDVFEQESGQLLVNRLKSKPALDKLMFYALSGGKLLESMGLLWGDKDLFRFAWRNASMPYHMVRFPPAVGGLIVKDQAGPESDVFCGVAMVQHDVQGKLVFFHRNSVKLDGSMHQPLVMTHLQQFDLQADPKEYRIFEKRTQWNGRDRYGYAIGTEVLSNGKPATTLTPVSVTAHAHLEQLAIEFSVEAHELITQGKQSSWWHLGYLEIGLLALVGYALVVLYLAQWRSAKSLRDRLPSRFNSVIEGSHAPSSIIGSTTPIKRKRSDAGR